MNNTKYLSLLSLAVTGLLCGATQALAEPLLDSDLASFTAFGAAAETPVSTGAIGSNVGDWSGGSTNAGHGFNSSPVAALGTQAAGGLDGLVFGPAAPAVPNGTPSGNDKGVARADLCNSGIALLDRESLADICNDIPARNNDLDAAARPASPANDGSNGNGGLHPGPGVAGSPDNTIPAAVFPSALAVQSVPEPAMLALLAAGLAGLGFSRRRNTQDH